MLQRNRRVGVAVDEDDLPALLLRELRDFRVDRLHRLVLLGMIDIYSSIDGYQDDVANLLDRLLMEEIHHLVDCPAASAAA